MPGGRTGVRTHEAALALARAVGASRFAALSGLECYEGLQISGGSAQATGATGAASRLVDEQRGRVLEQPAHALDVSRGQRAVDDTVVER